MTLYVVFDQHGDNVHAPLWLEVGEVEASDDRAALRIACEQYDLTTPTTMFATPKRSVKKRSVSFQQKISFAEGADESPAPHVEEPRPEEVPA